MNILDQLNSPLLYVLCGGIILYIVGMCVVFLVRAYRAGIALGMDKTKLNRTITSSLTFSILPSISILLGVIALSGTLGIPLPWLRLSVVGALHYETSVADVAARAVGLSGLRAEEMTTAAFTTIALVLSLGIMWSVLCTIFFNKRYTASLEKRAAKRKSGRNFGDDAMTAMFIGLITAYIGSYVGTLFQVQGGTLVCTGQYLPLVTLCCSALAMGVFLYFSEKKNCSWLDNFSMAGAMLVGMAAAVVLGMLV